MDLARFEHHHGVGAFGPREHDAERLGERDARLDLAREQFGDEVRVREHRGELDARLFGERGRVGEVAVVRDGEARRAGRAVDRLGRGPVRRSRRRVARVTDDEVTGQRAQRRLGEDVTHQTVVLHDRDLVVVEGRHAGRLLAAVLERVERVVTEVRDAASGGDDPDDAAGFFHAPSPVRNFISEGTEILSHRRPPLFDLSTLSGVLDLHTHSTFSDGSDTPTQLAEKAHDLGISAIALTDHDTTLSHDEMSARLREARPRAGDRRRGLAARHGVPAGARRRHQTAQRPRARLLLAPGRRAPPPAEAGLAAPRPRPSQPRTGDAAPGEGLRGPHAGLPDRDDRQRATPSAVRTSRAP